MKRLMTAVLALVLLGSATAALAAPAKGKAVSPRRVNEAVPKYEAHLRYRHVDPASLDNYAFGQSHIDVAWKWRMAQTHSKVYNTFSHAVSVMERYPDFVFAQSQPAVYEWMEIEHPDLFAKMVEFAKRGQWEITGGSWVEADGNMPDGEAYVMQRLLGQRYYLEHFGRITDMEWMPDTFGYNRGLTQIVARSGGKFLWCKKITSNQDTIFPFHLFHWRGPDGSELIASVNPFVGGSSFYPFEELGRFHDTRYLVKPGTALVANYTTTPAAIQSARSTDWINVIMLGYGKGDGGEGPQDVEVEVQARLRDKGYTRWTNAQAYFDAIAKLGDRLPVWDDEIYFERHRGVQTTHGWIKRANRLAEGMMRTVEPLSAFLSRFGDAYPYDAVKSLWKRICILQFHDILPGSSIPEVYDDVRQDHAAIAKDQRDLLGGALAALAKKLKIEPAAGTRPVLVYNPLGWSRSGNVIVAEPEGQWHAVDGAGRALVSQELNGVEGRRVMFRAEGLPSLGWRVYYLAPGAGPAESGLKVDDGAAEITLTNQFVSVTVDKKFGLIKSLKDLKTGRELIAGGGNRLLAFFDRPIENRAWDINGLYQHFPVRVPDPVTVEVSLRGPLAAEVFVRRELKRDGKVTIFEQRVRLIDNDPLVHLDVDADYHLTNSLTKLEFATTLKPDFVTSDSAYAAISRSTHPQTPADQARYELACQKWIDISEGGQGLAILNNGKYGFSYASGGGTLRQSLIKGAEYPDVAREAENVTNYRFYEIPYTDQGNHHIELALLAHAGDWREARLWLAGYEFNTPLQAAMAGASAGALPAEGSFVTLEAATTYIGNVKRAEDDEDLVVRLVEAAGAADRAVIRPGLGMKIESAVETDLLEFNPKPLAVSGGAVEVALSPFEIKTIKMKVSR